MKSTKIILPILAGLMLAPVAQAANGVDITITGSTAFRSICFDRVKAIFDPGYTTYGDVSGNTSVGTFSGTMANRTTLGSTPVVVRCSFSGSGSGMLAVDNRTPVSTYDPSTGNPGSNQVPKIAFSDVWPESASPSLPSSDFDPDNTVVGAIPFVWVCNNALAGVTNITREQAYMLMTASGPALPASFIGANNGGKLFLTGRDSGSGTRITTQKDASFTGTPVLWGLQTGTGALVVTNGYSSGGGGGERDCIKNAGTNVIGYLGLSDAVAISANAFKIAYEGVPYTPANVQNGLYPFWGYEHYVSKAGSLSAAEQQVKTALFNAMTDQTYQTTDSNYTANFVDLANMKVERGADGAPITLK